MTVKLRVRAPPHTHRHAHTQTNVRTRTHTHTCARARGHAHERTYVDLHAHTHTHAYTHAHTRTRTHTHTHTGQTVFERRTSLLSRRSPRRGGSTKLKLPLRSAQQSGVGGGTGDYNTNHDTAKYNVDNYNRIRSWIDVNCNPKVQQVSILISARRENWGERTDFWSANLNNQILIHTEKM